MRIARWTLDFYRLPYRREVVWANAVERDGLYALLTVVDEGGAVGVAEGTVKPTWSGVSARSLAAAFEDVLMPALAGVEIDAPEAAAARLAGIPENRLAKAMLDNALWQVAAARAGTALWRHWAQPAHDGRVPVTWAVTRQPPAAMAAEAAERCARHGFRTLKVKGGQGVETDLAALAAIRAAVGDRVTLYVDANSAYPDADLLDYTRRIADAGAVVAEDPGPLAADAAFQRLQADAPLPLLVDRACVTAADARAFLRCGARALSVKPGRIGCSEARAIARLALPARARLALGLYAESALGTAVSLQFATALPPEAWLVAAEQSFFLDLTAQVATHDLVIEDGAIDLARLPPPAELVDRAALRRRAP